MVEAGTVSPRRRDFGFPYVSAVLNEGGVPPFSYQRTIITQSSSRAQRYARYLLFVPRTYLVALPQLLWWRIGELWEA